MFILPVYNMVFFIVKEKESRAKESMRMLGLLDASYWLCWLAYYSIQITVISLLAWFTLRFNVFATSSDLYIFLAIWAYGMSLYGEVLVM